MERGADMADDRKRYEIKKYPNRRFYDVTRSIHVTLADLYDLVRAGNEIVVTDKSTGHDITNVVLAQIILEHDPPKLDLFPASLLHQAIQANEQMLKRFVDQYFAQAMNAFVDSRKRFDEYLKRSGFSALTPMAPFDWLRMLFPVRNPPSHSSSEPPVAASGSDDAAPSPANADVKGLQDQLAELREEMASLRTARPPKGKRRPPKTGRGK